MTGMVALGGLIGGLLVLFVLLLIPPRTSALVQLGRFDADRRTWTSATAPVAMPAVRRGTQDRLGRWLAAELDRRRITYSRLRQDLHLTGRSFEAALGLKLLTACAGVIATLASTAGLHATGIALPPVVAVVLAGLAGVVLWFLPDVQAHREADARRRDFRHAMSIWLDLVALEMAGSAHQRRPYPARPGSEPDGRWRCCDWPCFALPAPAATIGTRWLTWVTASASPTCATSADSSALWGGTAPASGRR
jgi:tight adherence protein C